LYRPNRGWGRSTQLGAAAFGAARAAAKRRSKAPQGTARGAPATPTEPSPRHGQTPSRPRPSANGRKNVEKSTLFFQQQGLRKEETGGRETKLLYR